MMFAGIFGGLYEAFPGKSPVPKGATLGVAVGITLLALGLTGIEFDLVARVVVTTFFILWTFAYGVLMGKLYRRYTREVQFVSRDEKALRVLVDGKDFTGRTRTFALKSSHEVRAGLDRGSSFKEWSVSGGVKVEDPQSFETTLEVEGDGVLIAQNGAKS
jgi:hypothetical protein